jgi:hypothetical protein
MAWQSYLLAHMYKIFQSFQLTQCICISRPLFLFGIGSKILENLKFYGVHGMKQAKLCDSIEIFFYIIILWNFCTDVFKQFCDPSRRISYSIFFIQPVILLTFFNIWDNTLVKVCLGDYYILNYIIYLLVKICFHYSHRVLIIIFKHCPPEYSLRRI